jgi:hypothetical protein
MDEKRREELRDQAWKYFALHADQRLKAFNFYLILCTVIAGAGVGSLVLDPALALFRRVAMLARAGQAGDCHSLASTGLSPLLATEIARQARPAEDSSRGPEPDSPDRDRKSAVGRAADPGGTASPGP